MNHLEQHWELEPGLDFLNHGSFGACPTVVMEEQQRLRRVMERQPLDFLYREIDDRLDVARAALAEEVGVQPADLAFVPNATTGVNTVLRSLRFEPGDELLTTQHEYRACKNALEFVAARDGAEVVVAPIPFPFEDSQELVDAVLGCATERTRLLLIDHITSPSALVMPLDRILPPLRDRGVDCLVDGAHAPGQLALDLPSLGATWYTGNCHKWLCTPKGSALLWCTGEAQERLRPLVISHGATLRDMRNDRSAFNIEFDWTGTSDPTAYLCIPRALEFLNGLLPGGLDALRARNRALALTGRRVVADALGCTLPTPDDAVGSMASLPLPPGEPGPPPLFEDPLQQVLVRQHRIEVPITGWEGQRVIRISAQAYNHAEQYERLGSALARSLP